MNAAVLPNDSQAERRASKETRRRRDAEWSPNASHPVDEVKLRLLADAPQRVAQLSFLRAQIALYHIECTLPALASRSGGHANELEELVHTKIRELEDGLKDEINRVKTLAETHGLEPMTRYTKPLEMTVKIYSPFARRFVGLMRSFDSLMQYVDALWHNGIFRNNQRGAAQAKWRNALVRQSRELSNISLRFRNSLRRELEAAERAPVGETLTVVDPASVAIESVALGLSPTADDDGHGAETSDHANEAVAAAA